MAPAFSAAPAQRGGEAARSKGGSCVTCVGARRAVPLLWSALALPAPFSAEAGFGDNKAEAELPHSKSSAGISPSSCRRDGGATVAAAPRRRLLSGDETSPLQGAVRGPPLWSAVPLAPLWVSGAVPHLLRREQSSRKAGRKQSFRTPRGAVRESPLRTGRRYASIENPKSKIANRFSSSVP